ncbi:restriction endonuclease [Franconibacter sp. IITDAS19]|uniref:restriction endonuclease n=1 Tax=Franconibacter sp. IITDAS19 TaxID=2930569 RepID=UPI001FF763EC|nr:restriction endonuclease [Franconibacter sp. IITDAS19]MCK1970052.1 restriction endonuclease [Franconibacter sp. IITDAS19]
MELLSLSPTKFENLTFDVVTALGLRNSVWRTPGSDLGRDIEGDYFISDLSGQYQKQRWYIECKRYTSSVDWPTIWNKISYAETHVADILLFVTSSSLSPQAIDQIRLWNKANKKPLIRFWGAVDLCAKLNLHPQIAKKYGLKPEIDSNIEIFAPSIDLLLRITNSLSPEIGEVSQAKLWLLHSFSELISQRILDANTGYGFYFKEHTAIDYFDWIDVTKVNLQCFDKYSTRVLLAYLFFVLKEAPTIVQKTPRLIHLLLPRELRESEANHIKIISDLSNYTISTIQKEIVLELI